MKIVFLDTDTLGDVTEINLFDSLGDVQKYGFTNFQDTLDRIQDAEIVLTNKVVIDEGIMSKSPKLKYIGVLATGTNNVDLVSAAEMGIKVQNVAGYSTDSVAQHTFALLLSLLHQVSMFDSYSKNEYQNSSIFTNLQHEYFELKGKVFGIIGLGTIGKRVAEIATCFGAKVVYYSTSGKNNDSDFERNELAELLKVSDVVSIHAPLNEKTKGLIGERQLLKMKKNAVLINTGRGGIIDESSLALALKNKTIRGACIDVFESEPIHQKNPLRIIGQSNLILSPHIAWASIEARRELLTLAFGYLKDYLNVNN